MKIQRFTTRLLINLSLLISIGTIFATSCYMIEVTKPDSGWIACDTVLVEGTVGYRLFDFPDQELSSTQPYRWTDSWAGAPGFADEDSDTVGEPTCRRQEEDNITGEMVFKRHMGNDLTTVTGEPITSCFTCILTRWRKTDGYGNYHLFYIPELDISFRLAHLNDLFPDAVDTLYEPGEVLGYAGMSGRSANAIENNINPHVHTEVFSGRVDNSNYDQRTTLDPVPYLFGEATNHPYNGQVFLSVSGGIYKDSIEAEDDLGPITIYSPSENNTRRFRDPQPQAVYQHTFNIENYDNGNLYAEALVCSTYGFTGFREILDSDEQPGQKLCGNHTFIVQTGGYSTLEETYNYTDHWNSECRSPDYYDFYDFDNWGIYEIDHIVRQAEQITVEGAVFHMPWNKNKIQLIVVLSDQNVISDTISSEHIEQVSDTRTNWTYTFPANEQPYGFAVKMTYTNISIGYWPKAKWARIKNARTFAYQKKLSSYGYIALNDCPAYVGYPTMWDCDSFDDYSKQMEQKHYQWAMDIDAQVIFGTGFNMALVSLCGRTSPQPPFYAMNKFVVSEPYIASRYGGFGCPDYYAIDEFHLTAHICGNPTQQPCDIVYKATCDGSAVPVVPTGSYSIICSPGFDFTGVAGEPPVTDISADFSISWGTSYDIAMALGAPENFTITASSGGSARPETFSEEFEPHKEPELPKEFALGTPRPNPFNTSVSFDIDLPTSATVDLRIYDILGNLVDNPIDHVEIPAGKITEKWTCENCPSGTYFIMLHANDFRETRKMTLVK